MEKQLRESVYQFTEMYADGKGDVRKVSVTLEIAHNRKDFHISHDGMTNGKFDYMRGSFNWRRWKAELKLIEQAIDFATEQLGLS